MPWSNENVDMRLPKLTIRRRDIVIFTHRCEHRVGLGPPCLSDRNKRHEKSVDGETLGGLNSLTVKKFSLRGESRRQKSTPALESGLWEAAFSKVNNIHITQHKMGTFKSSFPQPSPGYPIFHSPGCLDSYTTALPHSTVRPFFPFRRLNAQMLKV